MDFISVKDAAARWGLTVGRINVLANEGRIPGAQRIGRSWMIPAAAEKPADGRYKQQLQTGKQYHFPMLIFSNYQDQSFLQGLSADEQKLLEGQLACEACDFDQALEIMKELVNNSRQFYVRIGALFFLCYMAPNMNQPDLFKNCYKQLRDILATDFLHREDYQTFMMDIDSLYLGNQVFVENFDLNNVQNYSADAMPYLTIQSTYKDVVCSVLDRIPMSTNIYSLLCENYEQNHMYISAQYMHIYIACAFIGNKKPFVNISHLRRAIDLGIINNSYRILATFYSWIRPAFDEVLKDYDPAVAERIVSLSNSFNSNIIAFLGSAVSGMKIIEGLNEEQIQLMTLAAQGLTNKEVAEFIGIPEYTIRRRYETLLHKFDVSKKKQLGELFIKVMTDGYK